MTNQQKSIFERYPQLVTLRDKVPDEVIEREVGQKAEQFEYYSALARQKIPTVRLCDVLPPEMEKGHITLENFLGQWGNVSVEELCKICLIVAWLQPKAIFEFGTFNGCTTLQMAINAPADCKVFTLDIPPAEASHLDLGEIDQYLAQKSGAFSFNIGYYFRNTPFTSKIVQLWGDSTQIDLSDYYGQMKLVFVDAGHLYQYVKSDTTNALRLLQKGGCILWHNYNDVLYPDVTQHLYELSLTSVPLYHMKGTTLALYYSRAE